MIRETEMLGEKPVPDPLLLPEIPHQLASYLTRTSAVGGSSLTACYMALEVHIFKFLG
jgi:hypothetical protein